MIYLSINQEGKTLKMDGLKCKQKGSGTGQKQNMFSASQKLVWREDFRFYNSLSFWPVSEYNAVNA